MWLLKFIAGLSILFGVPNLAYAVLPPDLIFSIGAQFAQFFSFIALLVGGVASTAAIALRTQFTFIRAHLCLILSSVVSLVFIAISLFFYFQSSINERAYVGYIDALQAELASTTLLMTTSYHSSSSMPIATDPSEAWDTSSGFQKIFRGETIFLYGKNTNTPFYVELDLNRRQAPNGTFIHYYYLYGSIAGTDYSDYHFSYASTSQPVLTSFSSAIERFPFEDLSTREEITGELTLDEKLLQFSISNINGDFITKKIPAYTRHQSVGEAIINFDGKEVLAYALFEGIHSNDFTRYLFFDGSSEVVAQTHQFILWDEEGNFYMMDKSDVQTYSPTYPSHTWLLHKESATGFTKKGFDAELLVTRNKAGHESGWALNIPDFSNAQINLNTARYIEGSQTQTRLRALVSGTIADDYGERSIEGLVHIIK